MIAMTEEMPLSEAVDITSEVHTEDALAYARTIHLGLSRRERLALAAIYEDMPCSVSAVGRAAGISRRTAQRACDALEGEHVGLIRRTEDGLIIHPEAIGAVDAWAHRWAHRSEMTDWWANPKPTPVHDGQWFPQGNYPEPWPDDVFPDRAFDEVPNGEDVAVALRAVESRRVPMGKGTFVPFAVLDYAATTESIQAVRVAVECGRRADRHGVAKFARGELSTVTGLSPQQVSNTLARMRRDRVASSACTTRVELNGTYE